MNVPTHTVATVCLGLHYCFDIIFSSLKLQLLLRANGRRTIFMFRPQQLSKLNERKYLLSHSSNFIRSTPLLYCLPTVFIQFSFFFL